MNIRTLLFLTLALTVVMSPAHAETLDDASIRQIYAQSVAEILAGDLGKIQQTMTVRLNPNFSLLSHETQIIGNAPPQTSNQTYNKAQAIEDAIKGFSVMKFNNYQDNIIGIKHSADGKYAYVNAMGGATGSMNLPVDAQHTVPARYSVQQACLDTLAVVGNIIQFVKSECNNRTTIMR